MIRARVIIGAIVLASSIVGISCTGREGLDPATLPEGVRDDYMLVTQRCTKCHSLARVFNASFTEDEQWRRYVEKMRRQPSSGISEEDEVIILRFFKYYAEQQREKKAALESPDAAGVSVGPVGPVTDGGH